MKLAMKILSYVFTVLLTVVVVLFTLICTGVIGTGGHITKLEQLELLIEECFIAEADPTAMEDAAASAMVDSLGDRWSYYISAADYQSHMEQMNNAYVGVGMTVSAREDGEGINIDQVTVGGPAGEVGILPGDVLIAVNGEGLDGMEISAVSTVVKGEAGTTVDLTVRRGSEELTFTVERRQIQVIVAEGEMLNEEIGLISITNFDERCAEETIAAIEEVLDAGATSLIFDVRNNPGGYKDELVEVLDYLLPEGPLFRSEDYTGESYVDYSDERCLDIPMVVLVNSQSYSAAEFFAAALREYDTAQIVGEKTVGKGYFQQTFQLFDGSAVGLSVGKYYTPEGVSLAEEGITPDVEVNVDEQTFFAIYAGTLAPMEDPQILAAVGVLQ